MSVEQFINSFWSAIGGPLVLLMFAVALMVFVWGIVRFIANPDDAEARRTGIQNMTWGAIGMFIMFAAWGILEIVTSTFGINPPGL